MKKYNLELNERQVSVVMWALDLYSRLNCGQLQFLKEIISKTATENTLTKLQKEMFPKLTGLNNSYSIAGRFTPEEAKISYDIYKVIMYHFNKDKGVWNVYADEPRALSKEGLPKFEIKNGKEKY